MVWQYFEVQVSYSINGTTTKGYLLKADGKNEEVEAGRYGELMAKLGAEGWEMVVGTDVRTRGGDPIVKYFFKRQAATA